jgi:hypothetical protein
VIASVVVVAVEMVKVDGATSDKLMVGFVVEAKAIVVGVALLMWRQVLRPYGQGMRTLVVPRREGAASIQAEAVGMIVAPARTSLPEDAEVVAPENPRIAAPA